VLFYLLMVGIFSILVLGRVFSPLSGGGRFPLPEKKGEKFGKKVSTSPSWGTLLNSSGLGKKSFGGKKAVFTFQKFPLFLRLGAFQRVNFWGDTSSLHWFGGLFHLVWAGGGVVFPLLESIFSYPGGHGKALFFHYTFFSSFERTLE